MKISVLKMIDATKRSIWNKASNALLKTDRSGKPACCIGHLVATYPRACDTQVPIWRDSTR